MNPNECGKIFISAYLVECAKYESKKKFVLNKSNTCNYVIIIAISKRTTIRVTFHFVRIYKHITVKTHQFYSFILYYIYNYFNVVKL